MTEIFKGIFDSGEAAVITPGDFLLCLAASVIAGAVFAAAATVGEKKTKSFFVALSVLPMAVCAVIMAVNGNIGAGVAVAGAFGLVRFRSAQGSAREVVEVFFSMASGIMIGMGYIVYGLLFSVIAGASVMLISFFCEKAENAKNEEMYLSVTVPENMAFDGVFDAVIGNYSEKFTLYSVKTVSFGSAYRLKYGIIPKTGADKKALIDSIRTKNGNLEVMITRKESDVNLL